MNALNIFEKVRDLKPGDSYSVAKNVWHKHYTTEPKIIVPAWMIQQKAMKGKMYRTTSGGRYYFINRHK